MKNKRADKGVVLFHPDVGETILLYFDVFVNNMYIKKQTIQLKDSLYNAEDCLFVNKWQRVHKNYTYLGSEDLKHIPSVQLKIFEMLVNLRNSGFTFKMAGNEGGAD